MFEDMTMRQMFQIKELQNKLNTVQLQLQSWSTGLPDHEEVNTPEEAIEYLQGAFDELMDRLKMIIQVYDSPTG